ncbi:hypothetical protein [Paraburkholderia sp. BL10I2N1]|uniref:hypothetical protein n=1 Tax=Paraburkholderia sp. BL10I2N1 TaxID=1938796 RepID=UPI00105DAEB8|nr:hypothetical protein [Paraburkholderia sp. BL10I2N1]TDN63028.1 hypothetical protein B0G77_6631 [Paraburkholderia sp. BL10I2N1]
MMNKALKWIGGGVLVLVAFSPFTHKSHAPGESAKTATVATTKLTAPTAPPPPQFDPETIKLAKDGVALKILKSGPRVRALCCMTGMPKT